MSPRALYTMTASATTDASRTPSRSVSVEVPLVFTAMAIHMHSHSTASMGRHAATPTEQRSGGWDDERAGDHRGQVEVARWRLFVADRSSVSTRTNSIAPMNSTSTGAWCPRS